MRQNNMKIIGITGGIGSGKTAVLDIMQRDYGAFIMEAGIEDIELLLIAENDR